MIITCDSCDARYLVPSSAIGEEGRVVRCTQCGNEWHQEFEEITAGFDGEDEEIDGDTSFLDLNDIDEETDEETDEEGIGDVLEDNEDFSEDTLTDTDESDVELPDSIKPDQEESATVAVQSKPPIRARAAGYMAAFVIFLMFTIFLILFRPAVVTLYPPAAGFFDIIGQPVALTGEDLMLDRVKAELFTEENAIRVDGVVVNLTDRPQSVPLIQGSLRTNEGEIYDQWVITPTKTLLQPGEEVTFGSVYPETDPAITEATVRFLPEY